MALYFAVKPKNIGSNDYMGAMADKHKRLEQITQSKIIFAGGSNLAFGFDSEKVEREFSTPVVNLGLHAALGLSFILNELKSTAKSNDVVFLSIEYLLDSEGDFELKQLAGKHYPEASNYYAADLRSIIRSEINQTRANLKTWKISRSNKKTEVSMDEVYSKSSFNLYGDVVGHLDKRRPEKIKEAALLEYKYWDGIDALNDFYRFAKSKNISVFFLYPNFPESDYRKNIYVINKYAKDLNDNLLIEILNRPEDLVFPDSLFFDTNYHLNREGREIRTIKTIASIRNSPNAKKAIEKIVVRELDSSH
jgi:hypothetical protein